MTTFVSSGDRIVLLAHGRFPGRAKTAVGVMRYGDYEIAAVLDRDRAGDRVAEHATDLPDAPIVGSFEDVDGDVDALVVGVAPTGGGFEESWRADVRGALERGCDVVSGLHYPLADDEEFAELAARHGAEIHDVRQPPSDVPIARGEAASVDAKVVLTVGTDASVGKMTTCLELLEAARDRGVDAGFVPTGQTGIVIAGWGIAVDRVIADFASGAVEDMVTAVGDDHDVLFVEGQGSITHPAFSADTIATVHGSMADSLVLVHEAGRETLEGYDIPVPDPGTYVDLYESVAAPVRETEVVAGALNTSAVESDADARRAVADFEAAIDAPATDVLRFGVDEVLDAVLPR